MKTVTTTDFVVLLRVSTTKQGIDGNGINAQRRDIKLFLDQQDNPRVVKEFVEVISGANNARPVLHDAIATAKKLKCPLLVQKVDRLTRDVEVLGRLTKDKDLELKIACLPNADPFQIHLFGILGAEERRFISQRTRSAMAEAKKRGVKFGNPKIVELNKTRIKAARSFASEHGDLVRTLRTQGKSYKDICYILNQSGYKTRQGCDFSKTHIHRILKRTEPQTEGLTKVQRELEGAV